MTIQMNVGLEQAPGLPGQKATPLQFIYPAVTPISKGEVTVGNFVWREANGYEVTSTGTTAPMGIVERVIQYFDFDATSEATLTVKDNTPLTVGILGDYWVETTTAATVGQAVFAVSATGAIATGAPGTGMGGAVETVWRVLTPGAAGDMIKISNWERAL